MNVKSQKESFSFIQVSSEEISCDGLTAASKHPLIYLTLKNKKEVVCPYCGIKYVLAKKNSKNKK